MNKTFLLAAVVATALLATGCVQQQQVQNPTPAPTALAAASAVATATPSPSVAALSVNVSVSAPSRKYFYSKIVQARKGETALQVFYDAGLQMGVKNYPSLGAYVFSVQNINESNAAGLYWQYYFNNALAPVGVSQFGISQDGVLEWRLENPDVAMATTPANATNAG